MSQITEGDEVLLRAKVARANNEQALIGFTSMQGPYTIRVPLEELTVVTRQQTTEKDAPPESSWNYRVTRTKVDGEYVFDVREVYYTHGQPHSWSADPIAPHGESWHELAEDLVKMQRAVAVPVLDLTGDKPRDMTLPEMVRSRPIPPASTGEAGG